MQADAISLFDSQFGQRVGKTFRYNAQLQKSHLTAEENQGGFVRTSAGGQIQQLMSCQTWITDSGWYVVIVVTMPRFLYHFPPPP